MSRRSILGAAAGAILLTMRPQPVLARLCCAHDASVVASTTATPGFKVEAKTAELRINESPAGLVTIDVPLASLDTGIGLRNRHLTEKYLQVDRYPTARVSVAHSALAFPAARAIVSATVPATLTLHGVSEAVTLTYSAQRKIAEYDVIEYDVKGKVHININDFGVSTPSFLGMTAKPDVDIAVAFMAGDE
jgi:polyisoprenoid-binding protein YceI